MTKADDTEIQQSLADRLRALKTNQENWKNRINKTDDLEIKNRLFKKRFSIDEDLFRRNDEQNKLRPKPPVQSTKLADRMLSLEKSTAKWRNRVADKDNQKFTISGKMASIDYVASKSNQSNNSKAERPRLDQRPTIELTRRDYVKNEPKPPSHQKEVHGTRKGEVSEKNESPLKSESEPTTKRESIFRSRATRADPAAKADQLARANPIVRTDPMTRANPTARADTRNGSKPFETNKTFKTIAIPSKAEQTKPIDLPRLDADFDTFFKPVKLEKVASSPEKEMDDFFSQINELDTSSSNLLVIKKSVKPRNRKATTGNPLKKRNSSDFTPASNEDQQTKSSAPMETNSSHSSAFNSAIHSTLHKQAGGQPTKSSISSAIRKDLDPTAKAGLESKEDYRSVASKLKKSSDVNQEQHLDANNLLPTRKTTKCLIQVKGRKKLQVRLVQPVNGSINEGDSYVLITGNLVVAWIGRFSNIIERTRALEVASKIYKRKELGFVGGKLITIDGDKKASQADVSAFESCLTGDASLNSACKFRLAGDEDEDEVYESQAIKNDKVYVLDQETSAFKLCDQMCGKQFNQQQLNPYDAFLFDFGAEVYVWLGLYLSNDCRTTAIELAGDLFATSDRPDHAILYKCNQNMELILFQEKFDWVPNSKLTSRAKNSANDEFEKRMNLKTFDVREMLKPCEPVDFVLDNTSIGRGDFYHDENELLYIEVVTDSVRCWHANEHEKRLVRNQDLGQFLDTETYIVRWQYRINRLGNLENTKYADKLKSLKSRKPAEQEENIFKRAEKVNFRKHKETLDNNVTGRERFCYFYWQGLNGSVASKTAAALTTIELADKEKSTQIQVRQGEEPPCFLRLFKGRFVIYNTACQEQATRLFLVKGVCSEEAFLYEVQCEAASLRSKGCFVLVNFRLKNAYLWLGNSASADQIKIAQDACQAINRHGFSAMNKSSYPSSSSFIITTIKQSMETTEFLSYLNGTSTAQQAKSTIRSLVAYDAPNSELAVFHLTSSLSGEFFFKKLACTYSSEEAVNNFPFSQRQLYSLCQPTFFLVDNGQTVWLWQGHFPNNDDNVLTGSIIIRYSQEKKCALETVLSYCHGRSIDRKTLMLSDLIFVFVSKNREVPKQAR